MAKRKNEEKRKYWRAVLARHACSGLSIAKFCRSEGVSEASFYSWKRVLGTSRTKARKPGRFPKPQRSEAHPENTVRNPLSRRVRHSENSPSFVPVRITEAHRGRAAIRVTWPNGPSVRIPTATDPTEVENVLRLVDGLMRKID